MLSDGPLVTRTGMCSQYEVTALHTLGERAWGVQRRAQGLSLPVNLTVRTYDACIVFKDHMHETTEISWL